MDKFPRSHELEDLKRIEIQDGEFKVSPHTWWPLRCVMVAVRPDVVAVRDTKDPSKTTLRFTREEWDAFVKGVKEGAFDPT